jgi:pyridoxine 5-phosphate synthase
MSARPHAPPASAPHDAPRQAATCATHRAAGRSTPALSVNLNKVALLRNQRPLTIPSVTRAARVCIEAGAHGITVHPRPDERHIRRSDVHALAELLQGEPRVELNLEGNPYPDFMALVGRTAPKQCTLVPDAPEQSTSDHGFILQSADGPTAEMRRLAPIVRELADAGIRVSVFMDPDPVQIEAAAALGVHRIELYTEPYAAAFDTPRRETVLTEYRRAAECATRLGLGINAGHDLSLANLPAFCAIPGLLEVSIGHALIADAMFAGLCATVRAYLSVLGHETAVAPQRCTGAEQDPR